MFKRRLCVNAFLEYGKECFSHLYLITGPYKLHLDCMISINTVSSRKAEKFYVCCLTRSQNTAQPVRLECPRKQEPSVTTQVLVISMVSL